MNATRRSVACHVNSVFCLKSLFPFFFIPISHQINGCNHHSLLFPLSISNALFSLSIFPLFTFFALQTLHCCFPPQPPHLHHRRRRRPRSLGFSKRKLSHVSRNGFSEHSAHAPSFQRSDYWLNQRLTQHTLFHCELHTMIKHSFCLKEELLNYFISFSTSSNI